MLSAALYVDLYKLAYNVDCTKALLVEEGGTRRVTDGVSSVAFRYPCCRIAPKALSLLTFVGCDKSKQKHAFLWQRSAGTQFSAVTLLLLILFLINADIIFEEEMLYGKLRLLRLCSRVMLTDSSV